MSSSLKRKERRRQRYERNIEKEQEYKAQAWEDGKLIEENHNQGPYSEEYTVQLTERLCTYLKEEGEKAMRVYRGEQEVLNGKTGTPYSPAEVYIHGFLKYKVKIQDLILHWNPRVVKGPGYEFLKRTLETYWDEVKAGNTGALLRVTL